MHQVQADSISYEFALQQAKINNDTNALAILNLLIPNTYNQNFKTLIQQRKILKKYKGSTYQTEVMNDLKWCVLKSPEHSILELLNIPKRGKELD